MYILLILFLMALFYIDNNLDIIINIKQSRSSKIVDSRAQISFVGERMVILPDTGAYFKYWQHVQSSSLSFYFSLSLFGRINMWVTFSSAVNLPLFCTTSKH